MLCASLTLIVKNGFISHHDSIAPQWATNIVVLLFSFWHNIVRKFFNQVFFCIATKKCFADIFFKAVNNWVMKTKILNDFSTAINKWKKGTKETKTKLRAWLAVVDWSTFWQREKFVFVCVFNDTRHILWGEQTPFLRIKYKYEKLLGAGEHIAFILHSMCIESCYRCITSGSCWPLFCPSKMSWRKEEKGSSNNKTLRFFKSASVFYFLNSFSAGLSPFLLPERRKKICNNNLWWNCVRLSVE